MNNDSIALLVEKYFNGTATVEEVTELHQWYNNWLDDEEWVNMPEEGDNEENIRLRILEKIQAKMQPEQVEAVVKPFLSKKLFYRLAAAASIIIAVASFFIFYNKNNQATTTTTGTVVQTDVAPGGNKAILTLGDGSTIVLDSAANGALTQQGNVKVIKLDGQLAYNQAGNATEVLYNTINTPNGGQYQLTLADGTKVWLNANSSLHFPTLFKGTERKVDITGEAYFEVAKNTSMPFKVNIAGKGEVEVLGTHFNINAYTDEPAIKTTLLEGKIALTNIGSNQKKIMAPGQQAQLNQNGEISFNKNVDVQEVVAWKNGFFHFESADLRTILRQFARWYNIEVVFEGPVQQRKFFVIMNRSNPLSEVLKSLQANDIKFTIEGKKLTVRSE